MATQEYVDPNRKPKTAQGAVMDSLDGGESAGAPVLYAGGQQPGGMPGSTGNPNTGIGGAPSPAAAPIPPPANSNVGHDGTYNGMNREQYRDAWTSSGVNSVQGAKDWIAQHGGQWMSDNGSVMTPYGEVMDMGGNARGSAAGNGAFVPTWGGTGGGEPAGGDGASMPGGFGGGSFAGGAGGGGSFGGGSGGGGNIRGTAQEAILKLLADAQKPVDMDDPNMQTQMQARDRQNQRSQERARAMLAERAAVNGDLSGGQGDGSFESDLSGLEQARGEDTADFQAKLIGDEQLAKRQELQSAIQMAMQDGQFDQAQALQERLAQMDAQIRRESLAVQRHGIDTNAGLEGQRLAQSGSQFDTTMAFNNANSQADNYYRWFMSGLNG